MSDDKTAAEQVKEAAWTYTAWALVLIVTFCAGLFLGWQMWGSGEMGQPALAAKSTQLEDSLNKIKNEREDCKKVLGVTQSRQESLQKEIDALKAKAAGQ